MSTRKNRSRKRSVPVRRSVSKTKRKKKQISKPVYLHRPAPWYFSKSSRAEESYLRSGLKLVRRLYSGFEPSHGFDARFLKYWPTARVEAIRLYIRQAHSLTSGEFHEIYKLIRPRTEAQADALRLHTGQVSLDPRRHPLRAYVIYPNVRDAYVRYVEEDIPLGFGLTEHRTRVEVRQPVKDGVLVHRDYLFREVLGFQPGLESTTPEGVRAGQLLGTMDPWEQMVKAMGLLVRRLPARTSRGDEAHYRLLTPRGPIGRSTPRHMLVELMQQWGDQYDPNFVEALIGARYQGSEFAARESDLKTDRRRAAYRETVRQERLQRARITRTGKLRAPLKKPKTKKKVSRKSIPKKKVSRKSIPKKKVSKKKKRSRPSRKK